MATAGRAIDEVIPCATSGSGEALERLLAAVSAEGQYHAVQVAPDRLQFARVFRPTWAVVAGWCTIWVAGLGALFFLVKTTETCMAVIEADHRGTRIRLSGRLSSATLGRVREALAAPAGPATAGAPAPAASPLPGMPTAFVDGNAHASAAPLAEPIIDLTPAAPAPASPVAVPTPVAAPVAAASAAAPAPPGAHAPPPPGSNEQIRIPAAPGVGPAIGGDPNATIVPQRPLTGERVPVALIDDGQRVELTGCTLIGRQPAPAPADRSPQLVALSDPSMSVSKTHLAILHDGQGWFAEDRYSTNGVVLVRSDGARQRVEPGGRVAVGAGDTLQFGDRTMRFVVEHR